MNLRIELSQNPTEEERQAILAPLRAYNVAKAGIATSEPLALLVRDEHDADPRRAVWPAVLSVAVHRFAVSAGSRAAARVLARS